MEAHTFVFPHSKPGMRGWRPKSAPDPGGQAVETALGGGWGGQGPTKGLPERPERQPASPSSVDLEFGTWTQHLRETLAAGRSTRPRAATHLIHRPPGHLASPHVGHAGEQLEVLFAAQGKVPERLGGRGRHEDRLVQGLLRPRGRVLCKTGRWVRGQRPGGPPAPRA